jgi:D-glycero-D-manno-heptose 1,7-bisphosphate phosphatase
MPEKAVFLDKDGTLLEDVPFNVDPALIRLAAGAVPGLKLLRKMDYRLVVVSNQSGVARGLFPESGLAAVEARLRELLEEEDLPLDGFYCCPHHPAGSVPKYAVDCGCRKPAPGLILEAAEKMDLDPRLSWMVGDILDDVEAGNRAGCRTVLINNGHETEWDFTRLRRPDVVADSLFEAAFLIRLEDAAVGRLP